MCHKKVQCEIIRARRNESERALSEPEKLDMAMKVSQVSLSLAS